MITQEQKTIIRGGGNVAITLDGIPCVVVREDVFATVRRMLGDELVHSELRAMTTRAFETGDWSDPAMDICDDYET
jgi:hypothetical protein